MHFHCVHILIGGFLQRLGRSSNGVYRLYETIYRRYAGPATLVEYHPWYVDPAEIAEILVDHAWESRKHNRQPIKIHLGGFSFGAQTVADIVRRLDRQHVAVARVDLCEPVARRGRLGWLRAINPYAIIRIPGSPTLTVTVQRRPRWRLTPPFFHPAGQRICATHAHVLRQLIDCEHEQADNSMEWRGTVLHSAQAIHDHFGRTAA